MKKIETAAPAAPTEQQMRYLQIPLGFTKEEHLQALDEIKGTMVFSAFTQAEIDELSKEDRYFNTWSTIYYEADLLQHMIRKNV